MTIDRFLLILIASWWLSSLLFDWLLKRLAAKADGLRAEIAKRTYGPGESMAWLELQKLRKDDSEAYLAAHGALLTRRTFWVEA